MSDLANRSTAFDEDNDDDDDDDDEEDGNGPSLASKNGSTSSPSISLVIHCPNAFVDVVIGARSDVQDAFVFVFVFVLVLGACVVRWLFLLVASFSY